MFQKVRMYNDEMVVHHNYVRRLLVACKMHIAGIELMSHVVVCSLIASELSGKRIQYRIKFI